MVIILWSILLAVTLFAVALCTGWAVHIPGWSTRNALHFFATFAISSLLTILLCTPVALIASISRGYLLPIGFAFLTLILMNLVAIGLPPILPCFPWAFPALYSGVAGPSAMRPCSMSYVIFIVTVISGFLGTAAWWRYADQT